MWILSLLSTLYFIIFGSTLTIDPLGSLISIDGNGENSLFSSKYLNFTVSKNQNRSKMDNMQLTSQIVKYPIEDQSMVVDNKVENRVSLTLLDKDSYLPFFSDVQIYKDKTELKQGEDYIIKYEESTPFITDFKLGNQNDTKRQVEEDNNSNSNGSSNKKKDSYSDDNYLATCQSALSKIEKQLFNVTSHFDKEEIIKIDSFSGVTFALMGQDKVTVNNTVTFNSTVFKVLVFDNFMQGVLTITDKELQIAVGGQNNTMKNLDIVDFWIIKRGDNFYTNPTFNFDAGYDQFTVAFLCLLTKDNYIYIFSIDNFEGNPVINLYSKVDYSNQIPAARMEHSLNITKVGIWNDHFVIGSLNYGIFVFKHTTNDTNQFLLQTSVGDFFDHAGMLHNFRIKDFHINSQSIYCIIQDFGLKIFSFNDMKTAEFELHHPYLKSFETEIGYQAFVRKTAPNDIPDERKIVRVLVDNNKKDIEEFLIELIILNQNDIKPLINKLYFSKAFINAGVVIKDEKYSYLYDNKGKTLYMIRDVPNPLAPSLIFKLDMSNYIPDGGNYIIYGADYQDSMNSSTKLLIYDNNYKDPKDAFIFLTIQADENSQFRCSFRDPGNYVVKMSYFNPDIQREFKISNEDKITLAKITRIVQLNVEDSTWWAYIIIAFGCLFIIFLVTFAFVMKCKKKKHDNEVNIEAKQENKDNNGKQNPVPYTRTNSDNNFDYNNDKPKSGEDEEVVIDVDQHFAHNKLNTSKLK